MTATTVDHNSVIETLVYEFRNKVSCLAVEDGVDPQVLDDLEKIVASLGDAEGASASLSMFQKDIQATTMQLW